MNSSKIFTILVALTSLSATPSVRAQSVTPGCVSDRSGTPQCPPPGGGCIKDLHGEVRCSPPDGGILLDRYREAVCGPRSEEHTSELQSLTNLVCRLLLEKKKQNHKKIGRMERVREGIGRHYT